MWIQTHAIQTQMK